MTELSQQVVTARKRGVPIVAINTLDPMGCVSTLANTSYHECHVSWNRITGLAAAKDNDESESAVAAILAEAGGGAAATQFPGFEPPPPTLDSWKDFFPAVWKGLPQMASVYVHMGHAEMQDKDFLQGLQITRQRFKARYQQLVLVGPAFELPSEVASDIIELDEPLPDHDRMLAIASKVHTTCKVESTPGDLSSCAEFSRGMTEFQAEQAFSLSITKEGMDFKALAQRRAKSIGQVRGLELYCPENPVTFDSIGGLFAIKEYLSKLLSSGRFDLVVWLDEIEKSSLAHTNDTSGVNADQLGTTLSYMEDNDVFGCVLAGHPGTGKSEICKALFAEFNVQVLRLDLGAVQDQYVGSSQKYLRTMFRTVSALGKRALFIATANEVHALNDALMSRFSDVFFFDLPTIEERIPIWEIQTQRYGVTLPDQPPCRDGWVGRNIKKCCEKAAIMELPVDEVAKKFIVNEGVRCQQSILARRNDADGRYLSASTSGVYRKDAQPEHERSMTL